MPVRLWFVEEKSNMQATKMKYLRRVKLVTIKYVMLQLGLNIEPIIHFIGRSHWMVRTFTQTEK